MGLNHTRTYISSYTSQLSEFLPNNQYFSTYQSISPQGFVLPSGYILQFPNIAEILTQNHAPKMKTILSNSVYCHNEKEHRQWFVTSVIEFYAFNGKHTSKTITKQCRFDTIKMRTTCKKDCGPLHPL